jgi:uncharacterized membrane protein YqjE
MADFEPSSGGFWPSVREFFATFGTVFQNRLDLFALELREQKYNFVEVVLMAGASLCLAFFSLILFTAVIIFLFHPGYRLYVAAAFAVLYAGAALWLVLRTKRLLKNQPFSETIDQVKKDWQCLTPPKRMN